MIVVTIAVDVLMGWVLIILNVFSILKDKFSDNWIFKKFKHYLIYFDYTENS